MPKKSYKKTAVIRNFILFLVFLVLSGVGLYSVFGDLGSPQEAAEVIRGFGIWGPLIIIFLFALEILVAPIPGFILSIASGYAFGGFWGAIYVYAGNILGTSLAFYLSRRFGRPFVANFVSAKKMRRYDCFLKNQGKIILWLIYLIPIFPSDVVTFIVGLTAMRWRQFITMVSIAYLPYVIILNFFGASLFESGLHGASAYYGAIVFFLFLASLVIYEYITKKDLPCQK